MIRYLKWALFILVLSGSCVLRATLIVPLVGTLQDETFQDAKIQLNSYRGDDIVLWLNSTEGDLSQALEFAQLVRDLRHEWGSKITIYIENEAIGSAAIFPFLADSWITTPAMIWGSIVPSQEKAPAPTDTLNAVLGLISPDDPHQRELVLLARAMVEPGLVLKKGEVRWGLEETLTATTLTIGSQQLAELGITAQTMTLSEFDAKYLSQTIHPTNIFNVATQPLETRLRSAIRYHATGPNYVGYLTIPIDHPIDYASLLYVKLALKYYQTQGVSFVLLDLNSPAGEPYAANQIGQLLQEMDEVNRVSLVTVINNEALSVGALLPYASRFIAITDQSKLGAADPATIKRYGPLALPPDQFVESLTANISGYAEHFGRNPHIAEALINRAVILVERNGQVLRLESPNEELPGDELVVSQYDILSLNAQQMMKYGVADFMVQNLPPSLEEQKTGWPLSAEIHPLFQIPFFTGIPEATLIDYQDWRIGFYTFLYRPLISCTLLVVLMAGFYIQVKYRKGYFPGILALASMVLLMLTGAAIESFNSIEIGFVLFGILLIIVEILFHPGHHTVGLIGIFACLLGTIGILLPSTDIVQFTGGTNPNLITFQFFYLLRCYGVATIVGIGLIVLISRLKTREETGS